MLQLRSKQTINGKNKMHFVIQSANINTIQNILVCNLFFNSMSFLCNEIAINLHNSANTLIYYLLIKARTIYYIPSIICNLYLWMHTILAFVFFIFETVQEDLLFDQWIAVKRHYFIDALFKSQPGRKSSQGRKL